MSDPPDHEFQVDVYRSAGRMPADIRVTVTHLPTGLSETEDSYDTQGANRTAAWDRLLRRLRERGSEH